MKSMPSAYAPQAVEPAWSARWEEAQLFKAAAASSKPKYSIAVPPPNVTGELHMGHALNGTLQDIWSRYRRMTGYEVLWLPGTDHERYRHLVGRHAILPLVGRRLPIVADAAVQKDFGTGALKVTPGHDPMDWEIGQRHGLPVINGMHPDGRMNVPDLSAYDGLPGVQARELVVRDLKAQGYLVKTEEYVHDVGHCDRCGAVI